MNEKICQICEEPFNDEGFCVNKHSKQKQDEVRERKILIRGTNEEATQPNFLNGQKKCENCGHEMERIPINVMFVRMEEGKLLFQRVGDDKFYRYDEDDVYWRWACTNCSLSLKSRLI